MGPNECIALAAALDLHVEVTPGVHLGEPCWDWSVSAAEWVCGGMARSEAGAWAAAGDVIQSELEADGAGDDLAGWAEEYDGELLAQGDDDGSDGNFDDMPNGRH